MERYFGAGVERPIVVHCRDDPRVNRADYVIKHHQTEENLSLLKSIVG